jgi:hypothetical protein
MYLMLSSLSNCRKHRVFQSGQWRGLRSITACLLFLVANAAFALQETEPAVTNGERTIYIPYDKLKEVFEREGRGVFLPYEQFQKLWNEARSAAKKPNPDVSPVSVILVSAENTATIEKEVMVVRALLNVELLQPGWQKIPLHLNDAAILTATVDKEPARIVHDPATGYSLLFQNKETKPTRIQVDLEYAKAYDKTPGQNSVSFLAPQAPVNKWLIRIPESGVKVQVDPMLATTETPAKTSSEPDKTKGTEVLAFVGASPTIRIRWVPKSEGATGMAPLASVQMQHRIAIEEGMARTTAQFLYTVDRSELTQLSIALPPELKVINVFDPNVRKWSVEAGNAERKGAPKLIVELFEPAKQSQNLVVEMESTLDARTGTVLSIANFDCLDANRQQGVVAVRVGQGLRAEPTERKGLMQLDPAELPQPLAKEAWTFAYRFTSVPYDVKLKLDKVLPTIRVEQFVEAFVEPQSLTLDLTSTHKIENAGVFQLEFEVPADFELLQVSGRGAADIEAASIDAYRFSNDSKTRLVVSLNRRALGQVGTRIQLRRILDDPNLLTPTGTGSTIAIPVPRSAGDYVQWIEGSISIYAPESLRINPKEKVGVRDGAATELRAKWPKASMERQSQLNEILILAHAIEPVSLSLEVERKKPFVTVRQMLDAMVEPGSVKFTSTLFTKVQYSSLATLRLDVPEAIAKEIRIATPGIRETTITPPPTDLAAGYVAWELVGDSPWLGERTVQLGWQLRLDGLEIGKRIKIDIPRLNPRNVDQAWGQVVLNRKDSIDLQLEDGSSGLRPIDPRYDLMPGTTFPDATRAFEYQSDWTMQIAATRYALEQVKQTSIERAFVRAVVTRSNRIGVHATYRMRNARQRLSLQLPEGAEFDSQPLLINGQTASLERGSANQLYIPLAGNDPTQALLVELRYTTPGDHNQIDLPVFPDAPAVQTAYLGVFLPKERTLLASNGPWTDEFKLRSGAWKWEPQCNLDANALMNWVKDGLTTSRATDFQTDGVMYLYSTLRPEAGAVGALQLVAVDDKWWTGGILIGLLCFGLLFLFRSLQTKVVAVALLATIVIAVGAFAPTLASQLLSTPVVLGGMLMLVLWGAREIVQNLNSRTVKNAADTAPVAKPEPTAEPTAITNAATEPSQGGNENA